MQEPAVLRAQRDDAREQEVVERSGGDRARQPECSLSGGRAIGGLHQQNGIGNGQRAGAAGIVDPDTGRAAAAEVEIISRLDGEPSSPRTVRTLRMLAPV